MTFQQSKIQWRLAITILVCQRSPDINYRGGMGSNCTFIAILKVTARHECSFHGKPPVSTKRMAKTTFLCLLDSILARCANALFRASRVVISFSERLTVVPRLSYGRDHVLRATLCCRRCFSPLCSGETWRVTAGGSVRHLTCSAMMRLQVMEYRRRLLSACQTWAGDIGVRRPRRATLQL